jgi:altronate hydrolase
MKKDINEERPCTIRLGDHDNVVTALSDLPLGCEVVEGLLCQDIIPNGHKVAIREISPGEPIRKYGQIIGFASKPIKAGEHVHTHNVEMKAFTRDYAIGEEVTATKYVPVEERSTFEGLVRANGRVGTRNYIGVLATVSCSTSVAHFIADRFQQDTFSKYPNVDGVIALGHTSGCGMSMKGEGFGLLQRTLAGYARHPNFAGIVLVGLGCEVNQISSLLQNMKIEMGPTMKTITIQDAGGTEASVRQGIEAVQSMLPLADRVDKRQVPASHICLALECGGSDAYSGITANPALGKAVDLLVQHGGTAILSETPEIYGAEHLLTRRALSQGVGQRMVDFITWWEAYTVRNGAEINNNPTPGNKAGGLTTILEKSLGASAKGGRTNLVEVYGYAEPVTSNGLVFMNTPGYDVVSVTGMVAGGANVICFTTGRGTVSGFKPVPTLKLASNTPMYKKMAKDMDINCGAIIDGDMTISEMGELIFHAILDTASGKKTKSDVLGFGDHEFVPWQIGAVM